MKVLQVNCVYRKGSTGKIVHDIHTELLKREIESVVCYGRGAKVSEPHVYKTCPEWYSKLNNLLSRLTGLMYGGCFFSTVKLIRIIKKERPDIVHLHCINGYFVNIYRFITWLKKNRIKTAITLHAEFMHTANCGHALECDRWKTGCGHCPRLRKETKSFFFDGTRASFKKMKKAFGGFGCLTLIAVSDWIAKRAVQSPIFAGAEIHTIYNGISLDSFENEAKVGTLVSLAEKYAIPANKKIILHVTPSFSNFVKGGEYFAKLADVLPEEYLCVVVGGGAEGEKNLFAVPFLSNQSELAAFYQMASVFVITSRCDNYPTVCLEANSCGTPVVGFDVGGVKETIYPGMGITVPFGDMEALCREVVAQSQRKPFPEPLIVQCRQRNDRQRMTEEYGKLYLKIVEEQE